MLFDIDIEQTKKDFETLSIKQKQVDLNTMELIAYHAYNALKNKPDDDFHQLSIEHKDNSFSMHVTFEEDLLGKDIDSILLARHAAEQKEPHYLNDIKSVYSHVTDFSLFENIKLGWSTTRDVESFYIDRYKKPMNEERFLCLQDKLEDMLHYKKSFKFTLYCFLVNNIQHAFNNGMKSIEIKDGVFICKDEKQNLVNHLLDGNFIPKINLLNQLYTPFLRLKHMSNFTLEESQFHAFVKYNLKVDSEMKGAIASNYEKSILNDSIEQKSITKAPVSSRRI